MKTGVSRRGRGRPRPQASRPQAPRIVIRPNSNFSGRGAVLLFCAMALPVLGVGVAWTLKGYWLILPFAGLELVVLGVALAITVRRGRYREVIRFGERHVRVRRGVRVQIHVRLGSG